MNYGYCDPLPVVSSPDQRFYTETTVTIQASKIETAKAVTYFLSAKNFLDPFTEHAKKEYKVQVGCFSETNLDASLKYVHTLQSGAAGCTCQNPSTGQLSSQGAITTLLCSTKCYQDLNCVSFLSEDGTSCLLYDYDCTCSNHASI